MVLIEIPAALESQLEIAHQRFQPSFILTFYGTRVEERFSLSPPGSAEEVQPPAMSEYPAALRKSSTSALHEARTLLGAGASLSRTRLPVTPPRALKSRSDVPHRKPLDLAEVLANLATVLDEPRSSQSPQKEFGVDMGRATTETGFSTAADQAGDGSRNWAATPPMYCILHTYHEYLSPRRT